MPMPLAKRPFERWWLGVAAFWLLLFATVCIFRPLMPVDETRYMSVAWEMLVRDTWLLPTLNFEPYSHKPPMLFWLIRTGWEIFGVGTMAPRIILSAFVLALFYLTGRMAAMLVPQQQELPVRSMLMLAALPVFLVYASMIMFDTMLAVFVMLGLFCIWRAAHARCLKNWLLLGGALGLGILAKGPVALVYILPSALLAPFWAQALPVTRMAWYMRLLLSVFIGAAIGLCWAIPAAIEGGAEYAQKIFVTQSAGRMVQAFDHREPFWFYGPVVLGFLLPVFLARPFWAGARASLKAAKTNAGQPHHSATRFLLCVAVPVFVFFSAISSKQIHYMIPILPALCILAAGLMASSGPATTKTPVLPFMLMAAPSAAMLGIHLYEIAGGHETESIRHIMDGFLPWVAIANIGLVGAVLAVLQKYAQRSSQHYGLYWHAGLAAAAFACVITFHVQMGQTFLPRYDFSKLLAPYEMLRERPLAVAPKYDGEYAYAMRLKAGMAVLEPSELPAWFIQNPRGVAIVRDNGEFGIESYGRILYEQPFRYDKRIVLMEAK